MFKRVWNVLLPLHHHRPTESHCWIADDFNYCCKSSNGTCWWSDEWKTTFSKSRVCHRFNPLPLHTHSDAIPVWVLCMTRGSHGIATGEPESKLFNFRWWQFGQESSVVFFLCRCSSFAIFLFLYFFFVFIFCFLDEIAYFYDLHVFGCPKPNERIMNNLGWIAWISSLHSFFRLLSS